MTLSEIDVARPVVITGGAGFIGCNLANRLLSQGRRVIVFDNLSRPHVDRNLSYLRGRHPGRFEFVRGDVRSANAVHEVIQRASAVFHFAAQVAVTTSLLEPLEDFEVNVRGTLNVLEAIRAMRAPAPLLFTSTNKVYGALDDLTLVDGQRRCIPKEARHQVGVDEQRPLDFHSPYGCSKGAADQYVRDYARSFDLQTVVFRMSCIYGPRQFGTEDQGWLAHFLRRVQNDEPITIYGDGRQVRDVLFVEDLLDAMLLAQANLPEIAGQAFNIGGGVQNTLSLLELVSLIEQLTGKHPELRYCDARIGDQRYYVSDTRAFQAATGWRARVGVRTGIERLAAWTRGLRPEQEVGALTRGAVR